MNYQGLKLCSKYAFPPNSLSLCGPQKQSELSWYTKIGKVDRGVKEILTQFSTLYPYLCLIARENKIKDPFDSRVVEAYWLGNTLLHSIPISHFSNHIKETLGLKKRIKRAELEKTLQKLPLGALPHHAFHVMNIYIRTGHLGIPHTIETMDACLINWGKVVDVHPTFVIVNTQALIESRGKLHFQNGKRRKIQTYSRSFVVGDFISYHWGWACERLTAAKLRNLIFYTNRSFGLANIPSLQ
ncbi:hypothetical protein HYW55_05595 [Candidatus Gottesmanbacteria bacterium]|nr:hypothetical protein [Candidatus Gottesmanbacteria bacterium]